MLKHRQEGSFLIEAMISVLLFMTGLLALMGVAATAINQVSQSKYRNDASNLASELVGLMFSEWNSGMGAAYDHAAWDQRVASLLPQGTSNVVFTGNRVDITITWKDNKNKDTATNTFKYETSAVISK